MGAQIVFVVGDEARDPARQDVKILAIAGPQLLHLLSSKLALEGDDDGAIFSGVRLGANP